MTEKVMTEKLMMEHKRGFLGQKHAFFMCFGKSLITSLSLILSLPLSLSQACMQAQVHHELSLHPTLAHYSAQKTIENQPKYQTF